MSLQKGVYEQVLNKAVSKSLKEIDPNVLEISDEKINYEESEEIFSRYFQIILKKQLAIIKEEAAKRTEDKKEKEPMALKAEIEACNFLIEKISNLSNDKEILEMEIDENGTRLMSVWEKIADANKKRPQTSLSISSLFTGGQNDMPLYEELCREISTSDEIFFIISFIRNTGVELIIDSLEKFTSNGGKLKILTTTYIGATEPIAVEKLSKLPNTQIKISYDLNTTRLHAKSYIFKRNNNYSTIYIGSSNISRSAISNGLEWNVKLTNQDAPQIINMALATFDSYWNSKDFEEYHSGTDHEKLKEAINDKSFHGGEINYNIFSWKPLPFQSEVLDELIAEREVHNSYRNLVVAATGTGKTVISAFDYKRFRDEHPDEINRFLYVVHRVEILQKSMQTYRSILKDANFGELYTGTYKPSKFDHLFMTIETFISSHFEKMISPDFYDYIVVDEVHHGAAASYQELLKLQPKIMLGLTATPERMDGSDITKYFNNRVATEIRLPEAINRHLLVPFHYFGVSDSTDISNVRFERGKYNTEELTNLYNGNRDRVNVVLNAIKKYQPNVKHMKALGFCVSKVHARYMSAMFNEAGIPSEELTSDSDREKRIKCPQMLQKGEIKVIFTVDLYNEGVDIPEVNTILFLRPTESLTVFIQQLGRGLRTADNKDELIVLDFVGQYDKKYRMYEKKIMYMTSSAHTSVRNQLKNGFTGLPSGCSIKLEEVAKETIYKNIPSDKLKMNVLIESAREYRMKHGTDPTLDSYMKEFDITFEDIYSNHTFTEIIVKSKESVPDFTYDEKLNTFFKNGFQKLCHIDSIEWIKAIREIIANPEQTLTSKMKKYLSMLYYSFHDGTISKYGYDSHLDFIIKIQSKKYIDELKQILEIRESQIKFVEGEIKLDYECTLNVHSSYYRNQILAGFGLNTPNSTRELREGVLYIKEYKTDVFFITLDKSSGAFSPTTMYKDFAISEKLFQWQSQNGTNENKGVGLRYKQHDELGSNVLLFVRECEKRKGLPLPFTFLGKGHFVSSEGSKPMTIKWELENKIPAHIMSYSPIAD